MRDDDVVEYACQAERMLLSGAGIALIAWGYCVIRDEGRLVQGYMMSIIGSVIFFALYSMLTPTARNRWRVALNNKGEREGWQ